MDQATLQQLKTALETERNRLIAELKTFARPNTRVAGDWNAEFPHFEEAESGSHAARDEEADEVEEYEMRLAAENSLETRLLEVNRAMERLAFNTFGLCAKCRKPISAERLQANPAAEFDMEHSG